MCNASATFQRAIARALRKIVNREGSMVMAYIDDIVIATETVEDHMVRLREVFECLREAGFKMRVAKCDFMKSEIKYLGRVVSAEGIKPDPKAVAKLRDWENPDGNAELIPWHAKLVAPLPAITGIKVTFVWGSEQQLAFNEIKRALIDATALAQPDSEGEFVLDTDASAVAISGILHQESAARWANTSANVSLANRFETSLGMFASTSKTFKVGTSMIWSNTITKSSVPLMMVTPESWS